MQPRRNDSKKWTALPKEYLDNVQSIVQKQYETELSAVDVISEGRVFEKEIILRIGLLPKGRLKQHNFEVSFDLPTNISTVEITAKDDTLAKLNHALDFLGSLLNEFIDKNGFDNSDYEVELPVLWKTMVIDKNIFHFQYSTVNSKLETLADEWLNKTDTALVNENVLAGSLDQNLENVFDNLDAYNFAEQYDAETLEQIIELKKQEGKSTNALASEAIEKEAKDNDWLH